MLPDDLLMSLIRGIFKAFFDSEPSECWLSLGESDLFRFRPLSIRAVSADKDGDRGREASPRVAQKAATFGGSRSE